MTKGSSSRDELRARYLGSADLTSWLDFALIHTGRYDDDELAATLATAISLLQPGNGLASVIAAYYAWDGLELHTFDMHLIKMQGLIEANAVVGAAALMIDRLVDRRAELDDPSDHPQTHDVAALRLSISAEPSWVENHSRLALALMLEGDRRAAAAHLDIAITNILSPEDREAMTDVQRAYHWAFTGKLSNAKVLLDRKTGLG